MVEGNEKVGGIFEIADAFACNSTAGDSAMVKWMAHANSAYSIGLKPTLHSDLNVGWLCCTRWRRNSVRNFLSAQCGNPRDGCPAGRVHSTIPCRDTDVSEAMGPTSIQPMDSQVSQ